ncbi:hypothetical protein MKEN_00383700 [Mycena kentingensis (nom. inval.)]|nr:hypothetical protein MKEN_00383700 [Mycena kentingensis (nom. inval.)]
MRFSSALAAAATLAAGANALDCTERMSSGTLSVWKTGIDFGTKINVAVDPTSHQVVTTTSGQNILPLYACDGSTVVFPGSREIVITKGRIEAPGGCLGRNSTTGLVTSSPCIATEPAAQDQLWQFSLVYQTDGEMTGSDREIVPYKKGTFTHISSGHLELANAQGPSTFFLTFDYVE